MSELTERLIRIRDRLIPSSQYRADRDALAEAVNLLSDAERMQREIEAQAAHVHAVDSENERMREALWGMAVAEQPAERAHARIKALAVLNPEDK